jgi:hypothetical protein
VLRGGEQRGKLRRAGGFFGGWIDCGTYEAMGVNFIPVPLAQ